MMDCCKTKLQISAIVGLSSLALFPPMIRNAIPPDTPTLSHANIPVLKPKAALQLKPDANEHIATIPTDPPRKDVFEPPSQPAIKSEKKRPTSKQRRAIALTLHARHPAPSQRPDRAHQRQQIAMTGRIPPEYPPLILPHDWELASVPLPQLRPQLALRTRHPLVRRRLEASATPDATTVDTFIPWAERQANIPTSGLVYGNPHFAPHTTAFASKYAPGTVVVHVDEKRLFLVETETTARVYPIGTAHGALDILGRTAITTRRFMPTWTPTPSQRERDPTLPKRVKAGPHNPLGIRALGLGWRYRLIHGTSDPSSIGVAKSDGCIRMLNDDVADLYRRVRVGDPVIVLASADAELVEKRPPGFVDYSPYWKRKIERSVRRARTRANRRYAARKKRRR